MKTKNLYSLEKKKTKKPVIILRSQVSMQANLETAKRLFGDSTDYTIAHSSQRRRRFAKSQRGYFLTLAPVC